MEIMHTWRGQTRRIAVAMGTALLAASASQAWAVEPAAPVDVAPSDTLGVPHTPTTTGQPCPEDGPCGNNGSISLDAGIDVTTAYLFRGILQEHGGFQIFEPYADIGIDLYEGEGAVRSVGVGLGVWSAIHGRKTLNDGAGASNLYEVDVFPSLTVGWPYGLATDVTYFAYTSPNGAFATIQEITAGVSWDDSEVLELGGVTLNPSAVFGFETNNSALGTNEGIALDLAAEPAYTLMAESDYPITLALPLTLGLSLDDYYSCSDCGPDDSELGSDTFGYFSFGLGASVPLSFIPSDFGTVSAAAGLDVYVFGDNLKAYNDLGDVYPVGTLGIAWEY